MIFSPSSPADCKRTSASSRPGSPALPREQRCRYRARRMPAKSPIEERGRMERAAPALEREAGETPAPAGPPPAIHERLLSFHCAPDRDLAARSGGHARRLVGISLAAGLLAAA